MHAIQVARDMHAWLRWCTHRSTGAARELTDAELRRPFEMGLGSVLGTLVHLYGAERVWIHVLEGTAEGLVFPTTDTVPTLDALCTEWAVVRAQWDRYLAGLTDRELERVVVRVRDGRAHEQRAIDAIMQVPTHALYHNAQLSSMFRHMGRQLPDSSYIIWARERFAPAAATPS